MSDSDVHLDSSAERSPRALWRDQLALLFGVRARVGRWQYALAGMSLMVVKYTAEAGLIWYATGAFFAPWDFVNPIYSLRMQYVQGAPDWVMGVMFVWSLPFLWIAASMSVRRAADAGFSPWLGFLVLVPVVNLIFMLLMCLPLSLPGAPWLVPDRTASDDDQRRARDGTVAVITGLLVGGIMLLVSVYLVSTYGASLFLGTPLVMATTSSYLYNRTRPRGFAGSVGLGVTTVFLAAVALLLFALEGVICVAMALPLMLPIGLMGGVMGKAIADATRRPRRELLATALALPVLACGEAIFTRPVERVVCTTVEIDAPPERVWNNVVSFPELPAGRPWYFRCGIACPERARIDGAGVGAVRHCEFTTGEFVEPVTVWDEPRRLAFDVTEQPAPMFELSPYRDLHPPHLDDHLHSNRGEFLLVRLPDGRTRLEGRTWYTLRMFPHGYWILWSDGLIHRIHERVLTHVKAITEEGPAA